MTDITEVIKTPAFRSDVPGFDIMAVADIEPTLEPGEQIAHQEYINIRIVADGSNTRYSGVENSQVVLFFVHPDSKFMLGKQDEIVYASMYTDLPVDELVLVEGFDVPGLIGINLQIWSKASDEPLLEVCVAPKEVIMN